MRYSVLILLLCTSLNLQARDFEQGYATYGAGAKACREYTKAVKLGGIEENFYIDWVIGYFSAFNVIIPETYDILGEMDFPRVQIWLNDRCRNYPNEMFVNSVAKMTQTLYPMRYKSGLKKSSQKSSKTPARSLKNVSKNLK